MDGIARGQAGAAANPAVSAPALPEEAPLAMPVQSLWRKPHAAPPNSPRGVAARRASLFLATSALTAFAAYEMYLVFQGGSLTALEAVILVLYVLLFAWIAFSFATAFAGFLALLRGGADRLGIDQSGPLPNLSTRIALLVPTYNESPPHVMARIEAIYGSLAECGALEHFDFFILSDSTSPETWLAEEMHFVALRERTGGQSRIFYRHRAINEGRKSGNIADWVRRFGARNEHMIILDADSLMTGDTIVRLVAAMERHPGAGLIQTLPVIVHGNTLFARVQQFAGRVYASTGR